MGEITSPVFFFFWGVDTLSIHKENESLLFRKQQAYTRKKGIYYINREPNTLIRYKDQKFFQVGKRGKNEQMQERGTFGYPGEIFIIPENGAVTPKVIKKMICT